MSTPARSGRKKPEPLEVWELPPLPQWLGWKSIARKGNRAPSAHVYGNTSQYSLCGKRHIGFETAEKPVRFCRACLKEAAEGKSQ